MPMVCEHCGRPARRVVLQEKDDEDHGQLWCRPCHESKVYAGMNMEHHAVHGDEIPGGMTVENYGPKPIVFFTKSAMAEYRKRHGLIVKESFCPFPGTDIDPQGVQNNEGYVDETTMNNRRELILRAMGCKPSDKTEGVLVNPTVHASDDAKEVREFLES